MVISFFDGRKNWHCTWNTWREIRTEKSINKKWSWWFDHFFILFLFVSIQDLKTFMIDPNHCPHTHTRLHSSLRKNKNGSEQLWKIIIFHRRRSSAEPAFFFYESHCIERITCEVSSGWMWSQFVWWDLAARSQFRKESIVLVEDLDIFLIKFN